MEPDEIAKEAVGQLVIAVRQSVEDSPVVKSAMANLEGLGYSASFTVSMDVELGCPMVHLTDTRVRCV